MCLCVCVCTVCVSMYCSQNERSLRLTQTFNSLVLDFCNALWRDMIFRETARNSEYPTLCFDLPRYMETFMKLLTLVLPFTCMYTHTQRGAQNVCGYTASQATEPRPPSSYDWICPKVPYRGQSSLSLMHTHTLTHNANTHTHLKLPLTQTQDADILDQLVPSAIWQETRFKQAYLQFLTQSHLSGIADFIRTFIHTK